jgi:hypothetical protein
MAIHTSDRTGMYKASLSHVYTGYTANPAVAYPRVLSRPLYCGREELRFGVSQYLNDEHVQSFSQHRLQPIIGPDDISSCPSRFRR